MKICGITHFGRSCTTGSRSGSSRMNSDRNRPIQGVTQPPTRRFYYRTRGRAQHSFLSLYNILHHHHHRAGPSLTLSDGATVLAAARPHHHHQKRLFLLLLFVVFCLILFMISPPPIYPKSFLFFINLLDTCWLSLRARYNSPNAVCDAVNRKKKMEKKRINQRSISETVPFFSPLLSLKCVSTSRLDADRGELIRLSKRKSHLSAAAERSLVYLYKYQKSVCWLNNLWPDVKMICHHAMRCGSKLPLIFIHVILATT